MRFTIAGHAAVFVESEGRSLIVDPWLVGSCYWRSWWHYPPIETVDEAWFEPDYIYLTHHHFDHFHYPSLRRMNKRATVYIPRFGVDFMAGELRDLGFTSVVEMDHGVTHPLEGSFEITSYQAGFDDSALIVKDNTAVLADFNDAKIRGRALDQILDAHGSPTFLLKNHSWAQAYPHCYTSPDPADLALINRDEKVEVFLSTVREARPAFAIPFASNVCFLHPQTRQYNDTAITPFDVADAFVKDDSLSSELVLMGPGDHWSADHGFVVSDLSDFVTNRDEHLDRMAAAVEPQIAKSLADEAAIPLDYTTFKTHFERFLNALPPFASRILSKPVVFEVPDQPPGYWVLDFATRQVSRTDVLPDVYASVIRIDEGLLADAVEKNIVYLVSISMRVQVALAAGGVGVDLMFWAFLAMWELGYLPLRTGLDRRTVGVAWRRRREFTDGLLPKLIGKGALVERMASNLKPDEVAAPDR